MNDATTEPNQAERIDLAENCVHEAAVILSHLQRFFSEEHDDFETRLFARGQLARLVTLNDVTHSALQPDEMDDDDLPSLRAKLTGLRPS